MGWTGMDLCYCELNRNGSVNKKRTMDREVESYGDLKVVKSQMSGGNWYAVVEHARETRHYRKGSCFLMVCLTKVDHDEFLYKDMDDTVGPYGCDCPKAILDLADELAPLSSYGHVGYAKEYRDRCREAIRIKDSTTAFKNVSPGESVLWHVPEDSRLMMGNEPIAGQTLTLTKVRGKRSWVHHGLWATRVPTKYVNPKDCERMA